VKVVICQDDPLSASQLASSKLGGCNSRPFPMNEQFEAQLNDFKTDENELEDVLSKYDLDEALEAEFNVLDARFRELQISYRTLLNTRRFLNG
jgi:hypothetical protein